MAFTQDKTVDYICRNLLAGGEFNSCIAFVISARKMRFADPKESLPRN